VVLKVSPRPVPYVTFTRIYWWRGWFPWGVARYRGPVLRKYAMNNEDEGKVASPNMADPDAV
jgi:hypothetical protein